jgi:PBP1b-binding outer membrane lipoprotein LpoB
MKKHSLLITLLFCGILLAGCNSTTTEVTESTADVTTENQRPQR